MDAFKFYAWETIPKGIMAWGVPVPWLAFVMETLMKEGRKSIFMCVRDRETGKFLDPSQYELFIDGLDLSGNRVWMEEFPPEPTPTDPLD